MLEGASITRITRAVWPQRRNGPIHPLPSSIPWPKAPPPGDTKACPFAPPGGKPAHVPQPVPARASCGLASTTAAAAFSSDRRLRFPPGTLAAGA